MATVHLIAGLPCSGKTTYAAALRADRNFVLFTLDRWLITAYGKYSIDAVGHDEHVRRVLACRELIWDVAAEFLKRNIDVVFDDGFFLRENRVQVVALASSVGARTKIHFIDTPLEICIERLKRRNAELPRFNFHIGPEMLDAFVHLFERPTEDEEAEVVVVAEGDRRTASGGAPDEV
jgi:predicted kinase